MENLLSITHNLIRITKPAGAGVLALVDQWFLLMICVIAALLSFPFQIVAMSVAARLTGNDPSAWAKDVFRSKYPDSSSPQPTREPPEPANVAPASNSPPPVT